MVPWSALKVGLWNSTKYNTPRLASYLKRIIAIPSFSPVSLATPASIMAQEQ